MRRKIFAASYLAKYSNFNGTFFSIISRCWSKFLKPNRKIGKLTNYYGCVIRPITRLWSSLRPSTGVTTTFLYRLTTVLSSFCVSSWKNFSAELSPPLPPVRQNTFTLTKRKNFSRLAKFEKPRKREFIEKYATKSDEFSRKYSYVERTKKFTHALTHSTR